MEKEITVHNTTLHTGDVVNTVEGRARLEYIGRCTFTRWLLLDIKSREYPFGRLVNVEDNYLREFVVHDSTSRV